MVSYKLYYFNFKAKAELIRVIFAAAGQEYEDVRFERDDWPKYKPLAPFGQAPFLEEHNGSDVFKLPQSCAIARYLARKFNMAGSTETEQAEVDAYADQVSDLFTEILKHFKEADQAKKDELQKKLSEEIVPGTLRLFESRLAKNNNGFLIGNSLNWAEIYLFVVLDWCGDREKTLEKFPLVKKLDDRIKTTPKIAEWLAKRPITPY